MWIFSEVGFFSVVEDWKDKRVVWVRARWKKDLEQLKVITRNNDIGFRVRKIMETPDHDYPFRVRMQKRYWAMVLFYLGDNIEYGNFKGAILDQDPERERVYMRVWSVMKEAANPSKGNEPWEK